MEKLFKNNSLKFLMQEHMSVLIVYAVLRFLAFFAFLGVKGYFDTKESLASLTLDVNALNAKATIIKTNSGMVKENIDEYNQILGRIIPDTEDFFSIIAALENLSQNTGFRIIRYNINLSASNREKLALIVEGDGDADSFLKFLEDYPFSGGRLATSEKLEFATTEVGKIKLSLNFYHKKSPSNNQPVAAFTAKDIALMEDIRSKVNILTQPTDDQTPAVSNYETKQNPF